MSNVNENEIENISLTAKQIKSKLEDAFAYDHSKVKQVDILFSEPKMNDYYKLPFSDFKIAIKEELESQQLLLEDIDKFVEEKLSMLEEKKTDEEFVIEEPVAVENDEDASVIEEIYEFDDEDEDEDDEEEEEVDEEMLAVLPHFDKAKKPKGYTIKVVDVDAIIRKIKEEAIAKNEGKPVIGRRQINKLLKPYMIRNNDNMDVEGIDDALTSIDIYLSAVDKIANTNENIVHNENDLELNINEIINDLENK